MWLLQNQDFQFITLFLKIHISIFWLFTLGLKTFANSELRHILLLTLWIASAIITIVLLYEIDQIIHGDLYNFGLQFSNEWAEPYWIHIRTILIVLGLPIGLSIFSNALFLITKKRDASKEISQHEYLSIPNPNTKPQIKALSKPNSELQPKLLPKHQPTSAFETEPSVNLKSKGSFKSMNYQEKESKKDSNRENSWSKDELDSKIISCPKCNKIFSKPLIMLDFGGGKTILVNHCPYCSYVLSS